MRVICNHKDKCIIRKKHGCQHDEPHEIEVWAYQEDEPDCAHEGTCGDTSVKCVEYIEKTEIDFDIEELFTI